MAARSAPPLPMHVQQAAMAHQLGPFRRRYPSLFGEAVTHSIVGMIIGYCAVVVEVNMMSLMMSPDWPIPAGGLVVVLIIFGSTVFFLKKAVQLIGQRVYLFQQGLIIQIWGQIHVFPWSQIAEVSQSITSRGSKNGQRFTPTYKYTLRRVDGYQITLDNSTKNIAFLGPIIARAVAPCHRQASLEREHKEQ